MSATNEPNLAAIGWAEKRAAITLLESTKTAYRQRYEYLNKASELAGQVDNPRTRAYDRAASHFCMAQEILSAHLADDVELVDALWSDVKQIKREAQANMAAYAAGEWQGKKHRRKSKKASIKSLPYDWRSQICSNMTGHKHFAEVRILACTGCRPCEVVRGVQVYRDSMGINFRITGGKFDEVRGQEWRILTLPLNHPIASTIADGLYQASSAESLTKAITRKSVRLGFEGVSGYSFRHQMGSDLKASGFSKQKIANALGHISTTTQESYGNSGTGGAVVLTVTSSGTPRNKVGRSRSKLKNTRA
jgi:integrase